MRKAHFGATSVERRVRMSCPLSKDLQMRYKVSASIHQNLEFIDSSHTILTPNSALILNNFCALCRSALCLSKRMMR